MSLVYRATRNNRIVSKRYALRHPDKVTSKEAHLSPKQSVRAARKQGAPAAG